MLPFLAAMQHGQAPKKAIDSNSSTFCQELIIKLANERLVPLFSGAKQIQVAPTTEKHKLVATCGPSKIRFKFNEQDAIAYVIERQQNFGKIGDSSVNEPKIIQAFVDVAKEMRSPLNECYDDIQEAFSIRMIAASLSKDDKVLRETIITLIKQLDRWSRGTYEGRQHSAAIGIISTNALSSALAEEILHEDFTSVLSNGYDTLILCTKDGFFAGHETLGHEISPSAHAPYRLLPLATWAKEGKIALALNRKGEILIFKDNQLLFARRCGHWHFLPHRAIITQIKYPERPITIREKIYETCLDSSFAGSGACIGVVLKKQMSDLNEIITRKDDYLTSSSSKKAHALKAIIQDKKFQELNRLARAELSAIDGALLLDEEGTIISVGTILNISAGSEAGGRLAAARTLAKLGVGIKVSQDGSIRGFKGAETNSEPILTVM